MTSNDEMSNKKTLFVSCVCICDWGRERKRDELLLLIDSKNLPTVDSFGHVLSLGVSYFSL